MFPRRGLPTTDRDWEIDPGALTRLLVRMRDEYHVPPIHITENGVMCHDVVVDGEVHDTARRDYIAAHLGAVLDALEGWRRELTAAGLHTDAIAHGDFTEDGGAKACAELLDTHPDLDGIFAASDLMAAGALRVLAAHGKRVPEDVRMVGYDDLGVAERTDPPLTTLRNPIGVMATEACRLLSEAIDEAGTASPRRVIFVPELVHRSSA